MASSRQELNGDAQTYTRTNTHAHSHKHTHTNTHYCYEEVRNTWGKHSQYDEHKTGAEW